MQDTYKPEEILSQMRQWLKCGATIRATDASKPVLEPLPDGSILGGMTIEFPPIIRED